VRQDGKRDIEQLALYSEASKGGSYEDKARIEVEKEVKRYPILRPHCIVSMQIATENIQRGKKENMKMKTR
jgi:hypothetical protein